MRKPAQDMLGRAFFTLMYNGGETGIRTLGSTRLQRFSRPSHSTTLASLHWSNSYEIQVVDVLYFSRFSYFFKFAATLLLQNNFGKDARLRVQSRRSMTFPDHLTGAQATFCRSWRHPDSDGRCTDNRHACCTSDASCRRADIPSVRCRCGIATHSPTPHAEL